VIGRRLHALVGALALLAIQRTAVGGESKRMLPARGSAGAALAERTEERWRRERERAMGQMVKAMCNDDPELADLARKILGEIGAPVVAPLLAAKARKRSCPTGPLVASILCSTASADKALLDSLRARQAGQLLAGLDVLQALADEDSGAFEWCRPQGRRLEVMALVIPALQVVVRTQSRDVLHEALRAAERLGSDAAPLLGDLMPLLEKDAVSASIAAGVLGEIGPAAALAVPALRRMLRHPDQRRGNAIRALARIGPAANTALVDFKPILEASLPHLCEDAPRFSTADADTLAIVKATGVIGGRDAEPLMPALVIAFGRFRACHGQTGREWLAAFGSLGKHGRAAGGMLAAIVESPDERLSMRRTALETLDRLGPAALDVAQGGAQAGAGVERVRQAMQKKRALEREQRARGSSSRSQAAQQDAGSELDEPLQALAVCRLEAGLPAESPAGSGGAQRGEPGAAAFSSCLGERLCGPDEAAYRDAVTRCCLSAFPAGPLPAYCPAR
jgi:hypothetical protein